MVPLYHCQTSLNWPAWANRNSSSFFFKGRKKKKTASKLCKWLTPIPVRGSVYHPVNYSNLCFSICVLILDIWKCISAWVWGELEDLPEGTKWKEISICVSLLRHRWDQSGQSCSWVLKTNPIKKHMHKRKEQKFNSHKAASKSPTQRLWKQKQI